MINCNLKKKIILLLAKKLHIFLVWILKREKHYELKHKVFCPKLWTVCFLNSRGTVVSNTTLWKANLFLTKDSLTHCRFDFFWTLPPFFSLQVHRVLRSTGGTVVMPAEGMSSDWVIYNVWHVLHLNLSNSVSYTWYKILDVLSHCAPKKYVIVSLRFSAHIAGFLFDLLSWHFFFCICQLNMPYFHCIGTYKKNVWYFH